MYAVFDGKRDSPPRTTYQPHKRPVPTISIGNISPIIYTAQGPTRVSIKCGQSHGHVVFCMKTLNIFVHLAQAPATTSAGCRSHDGEEPAPSPHLHKCDRPDIYCSKLECDPNHPDHPRWVRCCSPGWCLLEHILLICLLFQNRPGHDAGSRKLKLGQAEEFGLVLRWNVVRGDGVEMHRTKHIRYDSGFIR